MKKPEKKHTAKKRMNPAVMETPAVTEEKTQPITIILLAFFIPVLLYLPTLTFDLTSFDDNGIITKNISFLSDFSNAPKAFINDAFIVKMSPFYRPLQTFSYMVDIQLSGGDNAWMYHLTNILLLGMIGCLLFLFLKRFSICTEYALPGTLIYCSHPLFVSSVAWVPARGDLLLMLFSLLSFIFFIDYLRKRKLPYLLLHWSAFTLALFCKETAAFLPFLFILYYLVFAQVKLFEKRFILTLMLYAISGTGWYWLRSQSIGNFTNRTDVFGLVPILSNARTIPESLSMFFIPYDIAVIPGFSWFKTIAGVVIFSFIIYFSFNNKRGIRKEKLFGVAWFLLLIIPTMLFKHVLIDYLSHRFFLPLVGILLFFLLLLPPQWIQKHKRIVYSAMIAFFLLVSFSTVTKSLAYANPITFYNTATSQNKHSAISFNNRGDLQIKKNDYGAALADFNKAVEIYPGYDQATYNRGYTKSLMGDKKGALEDFKKAISLNRNYADPYYHSGVINIELGNFKEGIDDLNHFIALNSTLPDAYNYRGRALGSLNYFKEAIADFDKAVEINPGFLQAFGNRSIAKYQLKDLTGSLVDCEKVLAIDPQNANALNLMAMIKQEMLTGSGK